MNVLLLKRLFTEMFVIKMFFTKMSCICVYYCLP